MADEVITELWRIKDAIAREHGYDLDALAADLRAKQRAAPDHPLIDLAAMKKEVPSAASINLSLPANKS